MPIEYTYEVDTRLVRARASGVISAREMCDYVSELIGRTDIDAGFIETMDIAGVEDFLFRYSDTNALKALWPRMAAKGLEGSIIHAPSDFGFGLMRMLQSVILGDQEPHGPVFLVVRTLDDVASGIQTLRTQQAASVDAGRPTR